MTSYATLHMLEKFPDVKDTLMQGFCDAGAARPTAVARQIIRSFTPWPTPQLDAEIDAINAAPYLRPAWPPGCVKYRRPKPEPAPH